MEKVIYVLSLSSENFKWAQNIKQLCVSKEINQVNYWMNRWRPLKCHTGDKVIIRWHNFVVGEATVLDIETKKLPVYEVYRKYGLENGFTTDTTLDTRNDNRLPQFIDMLNSAFTSKVPIDRESELGCLILQDVKMFDLNDMNSIIEFSKYKSNQHGQYHYVEINQVVK